MLFSESLYSLCHIHLAMSGRKHLESMLQLQGVELVASCLRAARIAAWDSG